MPYWLKDQTMFVLPAGPEMNTGCGDGQCNREGSPKRANCNATFDGFALLRNEFRFSSPHTEVYSRSSKGVLKQCALQLTRKMSIYILPGVFIVDA